MTWLRHAVGIGCCQSFHSSIFSSDSFMAFIYSYPKAPKSHFLSICLARKKRKFPLFTRSDSILAAPHSIIMCPKMDAAKESEQF